MPFIKIYTHSTSQTTLLKVRERVIEAVFRIKELGLKSKTDTVVVFPSENVHYNTRVTEVIITLLRKKDRTLEVKNKLTKAVGEAVKTGAKKEVFCYLDLINRKKVALWVK